MATETRWSFSTIGIGGIVAVIVLILAILMALGVLPTNAQTVGGCLAALAIARLC